MLDNRASASTINKLFQQLIEPIRLYAVEQWLPYIHPCKLDKDGPTVAFASPATQLATEEVWKSMVYSHNSISTSTPVLGVRSELGSFPTYIPGKTRLAKYVAYACSPQLPPLVNKTILAQMAIYPLNPSSHGGIMHGEF